MHQPLNTQILKLRHTLKEMSIWITDHPQSILMQKKHEIELKKFMEEIVEIYKIFLQEGCHFPFHIRTFFQEIERRCRISQDTFERYGISIKNMIQFGVGEIPLPTPEPNRLIFLWTIQDPESTKYEEDFIAFSEQIIDELQKQLDQ